jgi:putative SOS response-associated peptidase YedK
MCGRAALSAPPDDLREIFGLDEDPELVPRYNIAPTQPIAIIRADPASPPGVARRITMVRWGLIPAGADPKVGPKMINARIETVNTRPPFAQALRGRRCLVLVDGFYEWKTEHKKKRPFFIQMPDKKPFALAGLWTRWTKPDGEIIDSCTIITRPAVAPVSELHDRQPLVLPRDRYEEWLDPRMEPVLDHPTPELTMYEVSTRVNNVNNDDADCLLPTSGDRQGVLL